MAEDLQAVVPAWAPSAVEPEPRLKRTKAVRKAEVEALAAALATVPGAHERARQARAGGAVERAAAKVAAGRAAEREAAAAPLRRVLGEPGAPATGLGKHKSIVDGGASRSPRPRALRRHEPEGPQRDAASDRGRRFWRQRQAARMAPELRGLNSCLRRGLDGVSVSVVKGEGGAGFRGVMRCAGVWVCPCCAPRIAAARTAEIEAGIARHVELAHAEGHFASKAAAQEAVAMLTLTLRHEARDSLADLLAALRDAMRRMRQDRAWKRVASAIRGTITALEITHGKAGYHPHLHILLLGLVPAAELDRLLGTLREVWSDCLQHQGRDCGRAGFHVDTRRGAAARYVSKLAWEAAGATTKQARGKGGRTGWQLLEDACEGDLNAVALWREYALGTKGRNWLTWSPGLKGALSVQEVDDAELVEEEAGATTVAVLTADDWKAVVLCELRGQVLDAADAEGEAGVWRVVHQAHERLVGKGHTRKPPDG